MGGYYFYSENIYEDDNFVAKSVQVEGDKFVITHINEQRTIKLVLDNYWVGPGKVYVDIEDPLYDQDDLESIVNKYIYRGCTLLVCQLPIQSISFFKRKYDSFKKRLAELPIDYMIVPRVSANLLRPNLVKFFGKEKMPFVLIDSEKKDDLLNVKWEWIQYAQHFSKIPIVLMEDQIKGKKKKIEATWKEICDKYSINTIDEKITEYPLTKDTLRSTGISPLKGEFLHQGSADYNLFELDKIPSIDDRLKFRYHKAIPVATVSKGEVIKVNHLVEPVQGKGELKQVTIPNHFI